MDELEHNLKSALNILNQATSKKTAAKQYAVRWFNRLYYDLCRWNAEFTNFLQTYPGFKKNSTQQEFEAFNKELGRFADRLDSSGYYRGRYYALDDLQSDICLQINFLAARLRKDFGFLMEEDPDAYDELCISVGVVRDAPGHIRGISSALGNSVTSLEYTILGSRWSETRKTPSVSEVKQAIESHIQKANSALDKIGQEARKIGFLLLSVTEYEEALLKEGSANPNLYVIGEITMGNEGDTYNIGQAGAAGRYARSDNNIFIQSEEKKTLAQAAAEIQQLLKQLEDSNPSATEVEKIAYVNDETTPSFKRRVVGALRASSETALDEFILENKYLKVAKAAIKGWLQPGS